MEDDFNLTNNFKDNVQLIFLMNAVNFCFWADIGEERFLVEYPKGVFIKDGWYGLVVCFKRALENNKKILDAEYLKNISGEDIEYLFRSANKNKIPLIEKRQEILQEVGRVLSEKFDGHFLNALEMAEYDAIKLIKLVSDSFSSLEDVVEFDGERVLFLKQAQLIVNDVGYLKKNDERIEIKNLDQLTAFATYKIPQILRHLKVITYSKNLAKRVDNGIEIEVGSQEEIEIRSAAIWGVELIRQKLDCKHTAQQIDNALWLISQDLKKDESMKTHHRTRTIFY